MALGQVTKYNKIIRNLFSDSARSWDNVSVGNCMFILVDNTYTPLSAHNTSADLSGVILTGDGAPIAVTLPTLDDTTTVGSAIFTSSNADFGASVTITAKYLICVQPAVANTYVNDATTKLLFYVDLDDTSSSSSKTTTAQPFFIPPDVNGWFNIT